MVFSGKRLSEDVSQHWAAAVQATDAERSAVSRAEFTWRFLNVRVRTYRPDPEFSTCTIAGVPRA